MYKIRGIRAGLFVGPHFAKYRSFRVQISMYSDTNLDVQ